ncbi:hypothetical protein ACTFIU_000763 [Dictyostelium citrinum]
MSTAENWRNLFVNKTKEIIDISKNQITNVTDEDTLKSIKTKKNISLSKNEVDENSLKKSILKFQTKPKLKKYDSFLDHSIDYLSISNNGKKNFLIEKDSSGNSFLHYFCKKRTSELNLQSDIENIKSLGKNITDVKNKKNETALFSTLKNQHLGLIIMHELISRNVITISDQIREQLLLKCLEEGRIDMVKYLFTIDYNLISKVKYINFNNNSNNNNSPTFQFAKLIYDQYEIIQGIGLKSSNIDYLKLFIIQFILGNFSKESINQIISEYKLPQISIALDDFFFVYNYQMNDFRSFTEIKQSYINEISQIKIYQIDQIVIDKKVLGSGGNGSVHSGLLKESDSQGKEILIPVAIKIPFKFSKPYMVGIYKELAIHHMVNGRCGPKLYGWVKLNIGFGIIIERMDYSLYDYVQNNKIDFDLFFDLAIKMITTIRDLHKYNFREILHRDVKPSNWLVKKNNEQLELVLSDFGLSRENSVTNEYTLMKNKGTSPFIPPELNENVLYNEKSDIYSLGVSLMMLLYKVVYGKLENPFFEFKIVNMDYFKSVVALEFCIIPIVPTFLPDNFKEFLFLTMNRIYKLRPNSEECLETLKKIKIQYENDKTKWVINNQIIEREKSLFTDSILLQQSNLLEQVKKYQEKNVDSNLKITKKSQSQIKEDLLLLIKMKKNEE